MEIENIRKEVSKISNSVRINSLVSIYKAGSGHPGGVLSVADLITYLFCIEMHFDINDMNNQMRDRLILSKGHSCPALYAIASKVGLIDKSRLNGLRKLNHELQGHPNRKSTPWVEASTGSLGQGFSFAIGEAFGLKYQKVNNRVYVILGDGELQEGEVWEGAMLAGHYSLDNLCAIIDYNKMQSDDYNANIIGLEPLFDKWISFNWHTIEIDGHNFFEIEKAFNEARVTNNKPTVIIAHTIKGKGVPYMEGSPAWHGSTKLSDEDIRQALQYLGVKENEMEDYLNE